MALPLNATVTTSGTAVTGITSNATIRVIHEGGLQIQTDISDEGGDPDWMTVYQSQAGGSVEMGINGTKARFVATTSAGCKLRAAEV